jgi:hypothetical protein
MMQACGCYRRSGLQRGTKRLGRGYSLLSGGSWTVRSCLSGHLGDNPRARTMAITESEHPRSAPTGHSAPLSSLPSICLRRLHGLCGWLRTDSSVMAGGWAVSGADRFSRGWLPAPGGRSRRPAMFGTLVQLSPLKPYADEEDMEGGAACRLGRCRPRRVLGCDHEGGPTWWWPRAPPGSRSLADSACQAAGGLRRDRLAGVRDRRARMCSGGPGGRSRWAARFALSVL